MFLHYWTWILFKYIKTKRFIIDVKGLLFQIAILHYFGVLLDTSLFCIVDKKAKFYVLLFYFRISIVKYKTSLV